MAKSTEDNLVEDKSEWRVYILRCADNSLYTGVTSDLPRRLRQHNGEIVGGARYTRARRPIELVWSEPAASKSDALKREHALKQLGRAQKESLLNDIIS